MNGDLESSQATVRDLIDLLGFLTIEVVGALTPYNGEARKAFYDIADGLDQCSLQCEDTRVAGLLQLLSSRIKDTD